MISKKIPFKANEFKDFIFIDTRHAIIKIADAYSFRLIAEKHLGKHKQGVNAKKSFRLFQRTADHATTDFHSHLHTDLHSALITWRALLEARKQVSDIIPRMPIQPSSQALLVKVMGNQSDASAQYEQSIKDTHAEVILGFLGAESTAVAE